jgi:hypothetical protein
MFLVRMALVEKHQGALEKLINLFFTDLVRREEIVKIEVRESAMGHALRQKLS